jgi:signal transduction histidine kinase
MKWFTKKYAYPLVVLAMIVSVGLQVVWLRQLYSSQKVQVKRDLDDVVDNVVKSSNYLSMLPGNEANENFLSFFQSPEWLQFKEAYSRMRGHKVMSRFESDVNGDSTVVSINIKIPNKNYVRKPHRVQRMFEHGETQQEQLKLDSVEYVRLDSLMRQELLKNRIRVTYFIVKYDWESGQILNGYTVGKVRRADYRSEALTYNIRLYHNFQLVVPSLQGIVFYRMRYYLLSSFFMLLLTGAAFYFVFRLMKHQHVYAQARIAFTSNMTHELKTPVAVMEAALDAITRYQLTNDPEKLLQYISISRTELHRLNMMIEKVLNLDEVDNGETRLRSELYDVQQGLEQVVTSMQLKHKGAGIHYQPSEEPCFLDGDPVHLTNVFYNLIDNALKYGGKDVEVDVKCYCTEENIVISVKDNGPGISRIYHERIFERFFRVQDNVDVHNVKGSGLGLNYVKQIVEKHGGKIRVVSELGKGSEFIIELPVYNEV